MKTGTCQFCGFGGVEIETLDKPFSAKGGRDLCSVCKESRVYEAEFLKKDALLVAKHISWVANAILWEVRAKDGER